MRLSPAFLRRARSTTVGVFVVAMAVIFGVLWVNFGGAMPGVTGGYSVTASLADTQNLVYDSEVRMAGVPIGKIRGLERTPGSVNVKMELRGDAVPLHEGAKVVLRAKTLIEETYIEVTDGTGPAIEDGGRLPGALAGMSGVVDRLDRTADLARPVVDGARPLVADLRPLLAAARPALADTVAWSHRLDPLTANLVEHLPDLAAFVYQGNSVFQLEDANGPILRGLVVMGAETITSILVQHTSSGDTPNPGGANR